MDGTLTRPIHDFEAIRAAMEIPSGQPILEYLDQLPSALAEPLYAKLDSIEHGLAARATRPDGVLELLERLRELGKRLGIVTRNSRDIALKTLNVCSLDHFFLPDDVVGREQASPKPQPDGIELLLHRWGAAPNDTVMIGDFLYDLQAGRAAGTATVYVDHSGEFPWACYADQSVEDLAVLLHDFHPSST